VDEGAEGERSEGYAPGCVEPIAVLKTPKELAIGGEDISCNHYNHHFSRVLIAGSGRYDQVLLKLIICSSSDSM
jgi:hypothetical protein